MSAQFKTCASICPIDAVEFKPKSFQSLSACLIYNGREVCMWKKYFKAAKEAITTTHFLQYKFTCEATNNFKRLSNQLVT